MKIKLFFQKLGKLFIISASIIIMLLGLTSTQLLSANTTHINDRVELLSSSSENTIEAKINEFTKSTNLDLKVDIISKPEQDTLLNNARKRANNLADGYYILIATELNQYIDNQKPTIAIAPSPSQYGQLDNADYEQIVKAFQPKKQINPTQAIVTSIDTLEKRVADNNRSNILIIFWRVIVFVVISIVCIMLVKSNNRKYSGGYRSTTKRSTTSSTTNFVSSCSSDDGGSSCGNSCGSSCGSSCGGGCGSS